MARKREVSDYRLCKHQWEVKDRDEKMRANCYICAHCHSMRRTIKGTYHYFDVNGNPFTYVPIEDEGEKALEDVEKQIEEWKKEKTSN